MYIIQSEEIKFDFDFRAYLEYNLKRYVDDCFIIFPGTEQDLEKYFTIWIHYTQE